MSLERAVGEEVGEGDFGEGGSVGPLSVSSGMCMRQVVLPAITMENSPDAQAARALKVNVWFPPAASK